MLMVPFTGHPKNCPIDCSMGTSPGVSLVFHGKSDGPLMDWFMAYAIYNTVDNTMECPIATIVQDITHGSSRVHGEAFAVVFNPKYEP